MIKKIHKAGNHTSIEFTPDKKVHTAPVITGSYLDEETGAIMHTLENGNAISDDNYMKMWGVSKGVILPKNSKGKGIDTRTNWRK